MDNTTVTQSYEYTVVEKIRMGHPATPHLHGLKEVYGNNGFTGLVFSITRFAVKKPLPHPYSTRFSYRSQLLEEAVVSLPDSSLPPREHMNTYLHGFTEELYHLYGFGSDGDPGDYLSEYSRKCAGNINDDIEMLRDKERFHEYMADNGFECHLPTLFGHIENGSFESASDRELEAVIREEGTVVIKGVTGGGGHGVYICEWNDGRLELYGKDGVADDLESVMPELDRSIVTEYCEQAAYLDDIYAGAPNTIRVLTMNPDYGEPFIPAAVHRFGTSDSGALDNFSQNGLSAHIDIESGELSAAAGVSDTHNVEWCDSHPDTGSSINGFTIPAWESIRDELLTIVEQLPELNYAGWDLLITSPGEFVIIEGNHFPDPDVIQVHEPLLTDQRVRTFFTENSVPL
ncbi:sugar-transfer associated ATP-grasp domain-containing protein [Natronosalvus vescus]|uniref:sugar-transfer associated ATP-grasp domain-containing protein n=1 Tax=Natronosalvus vescus TaxID=2953881 RepID=UPI00209105AD|nr:sugar-transfer associated ATP-grasp domain-containing protein [Natronosalvus vescus]